MNELVEKLFSFSPNRIDQTRRDIPGINKGTLLVVIYHVQSDKH